MIENTIKILTEIIGSAEKLGTLSAAAVWAFFTLLLITYIIWNLRAQKQAELKAFEMRIRDSRADLLTIKTIEKLVSELRDLKYQIKCIGGKDV